MQQPDGQLVSVQVPPGGTGGMTMQIPLQQPIQTVVHAQVVQVQPQGQQPMMIPMAQGQQQFQQPQIMHATPKVMPMQVAQQPANYPFPNKTSLIEKYGKVPCVLNVCVCKSERTNT